MLKQIFSLFIFTFAIGCSKTPPAPSSNKPLVLVSIAPYQYLVERLVGNSIDVKSVVPQASNPHAYEPTAREVMGFANGAIWFRIGEPFEEKIIPILLERNPSLQIQDLRDGIDLIAESSSLTCQCCSMDHLDRHIWLSPKLTALQVDKITSALSSLFPEKEAEFQRNKRALIYELDTLDREIRSMLVDVEHRKLLVSHPAFGYFCRDYEIEQLSIEYEGKDPRPKHLEEILKRAIEGSMQFALALPQHNNKGAQLIAKRMHIPVHWIDPYSHDYFKMMRELTQLIATQETAQPENK